jgi:hypothetical protein
MTAPCYDGCQSEAARVRMKAITDAGRITDEALALMGWKGHAGFCGTGNYTAAGRKPGYVKEARVA